MIFFDLDGTLHKQDIFGSFILYLIIHNPLNILLVLLLSPLILMGFIVMGFNACFPMSLLLWSITFGRNENSLLQKEKEFVRLFRSRIKIFPIVQKKLIDYLNDNNDVWIITGSPQSLVEQIYFDFSFFGKINLIASKMTSNYWGGRILQMRCIGNEKVIQLEKKIGKPLKLHSGYSDSKKDDPLLFFCQERWRITSIGKIKKI
ncbi:acid phosphatase AphA [Pantoea sp. SoEX]|nr:acid phosphatase AphA [Pantoea sp. SoEX]